MDNSGHTVKPKDGNSRTSVRGVAGGSAILDRGAVDDAAPQGMHFTGASGALRRGQSWRGFTLIELLIVVAIIAILAAIAVPNFLEAQTRAKVARVKADLRSITTALESYRTSENDYPPNDGNFNVLPIQLSTPIAYLSNTNLIDPFTEAETDPVYGELIRFFTYTKIVTLQELFDLADSGAPLPPIEAVDSPGLNEGAFEKYGKWRLVSFGPDKKYSDASFNPIDPVLKGSDVRYDPTNGTTSFGNIHRTQSERPFIK